MGSRHLYFAGDRLSEAELTAACLDGHLVELGEGYIPADAVETSALRAASLAVIVREGLAATHLSAAWVHGALPQPPGRHAVQRAGARRPHHVLGRRFAYRDVRVDVADLVRVGGVLVTTPTRTLADLARVADAAHRRAAALMVADGVASPADALDWLDRRGPVPYTRRAAALLRALEDRATAQDEVTRYTS